MRRTIEEEAQLLDGAHGAFPLCEFGFEFQLPTVISKCYRVSARRLLQRRW